MPKHDERQERPMSGAEWQRRRVAKGLPRLTDRERDYRREYRQRPDEKAKDAARHARRRAENRAWLQAYKVEKGCTDCGYSAHHAALEFDHIYDDKVENVSSLAGRSRAAILAEIAKCEVVCANCHGIRTWERAEGWQGAGRGEGTTRSE